MATSRSRDIFKELLTFSLPIILGQLGQVFFGIGDVFVAGRYSSDVVAALGIAEGIFAPFLLLGLSTTFAISAITAQTRGEGKNPLKLLGSALTMSAITSLGLILILNLCIQLIPLLNFQNKLQVPMQAYLNIVSFSLFPVLIYQALKEYLQALEKIYVANILILFFNILNILLNILFMFGTESIPEMGIRGAALATLLTRSLMAICLFAYAAYALKLFNGPGQALSANWKTMRRFWKLGLPIGLGSLSEVLVFSTVTLLIGKMEVLSSASHNIVLKYASATFMIPYALASAATVKIGHAFGKKNPRLLLQYALCTILLSTFIMGLTSSMYFLIPEKLIRLATPDLALIKNGAAMLFFVALFQVPDGLQVCLWGILRGMGITTRPMIICILTTWLVGLPIGMYLAYNTVLGAQGLWAGLAIGLSLMAIGLSILLFKSFKSFQQATLANVLKRPIDSSL